MRAALPILPSRPTCVEGDFDTVLDEPHFRAGPFVPNYNDGDSRLLNVAPRDVLNIPSLGSTTRLTIALTGLSPVSSSSWLAR